MSDTQKRIDSAKDMMAELKLKEGSACFLNEGQAVINDYLDGFKSELVDLNLGHFSGELVFRPKDGQIEVFVPFKLEDVDYDFELKVDMENRALTPGFDITSSEYVFLQTITELRKEISGQAMIQEFLDDNDLDIDSFIDNDNGRFELSEHIWNEMNREGFECAFEPEMFKVLFGFERDDLVTTQDLIPDFQSIYRLMESGSLPGSLLNKHERFFLELEGLGSIDEVEESVVNAAVSELKKSEFSELIQALGDHGNFKMAQIEFDKIMTDVKIDEASEVIAKMYINCGFNNQLMDIKSVVGEDEVQITFPIKIGGPGVRYIVSSDKEGLVDHAVIEAAWGFGKVSAAVDSYEFKKHLEERYVNQELECVLLSTPESCDFSLVR